MLRYRHAASGDVYELLHMGYWEKTMTPVVIYRNKSGVVFVRDLFVFFDGRFMLMGKDEEA